VDVGLLSVPAPLAGEIVQDFGSTPLLAGSLFTMAVICEVAPAPTGLTDAEMETTMLAKSIVREIDFVGSATDVAVMVTATSFAGGVPGAVYVVGSPLEVVVGDTLPQGAGAQETVHATPLLEESFTTWAMMVTEPPAATKPLLCCVIATEMG
jgi:hypothetical protein